VPPNPWNGPCNLIGDADDVEDDAELDVDDDDDHEDDDEDKDDMTDRTLSLLLKRHRFADR
jgi:hypothetical protein